MKRTITMLLSMILLTGIFAQTDRGLPTAVPFKTANSVLYGHDVVVEDQPDQNQRNAKLAIAFNGWIYVCYTVEDGGFYIARSEDNGITWLNSTIMWGNFKFKKLDIVVTGTTEADLKVFVAYTCTSIVDETNWYAGYGVWAGDFSYITYQDLDHYTSTGGFRDVSIASDYRFPSLSTSPFSVAILVSKFSSPIDELAIYISGDGGNTFPDKQIVTTTTLWLRNIDLSFGRCPLYNNGRYFAVWEEVTGSVAVYGKIYTAHSVTFFNDAFTTPISIDDLVPALAGLCRNPVIATSFGDADNNQSDLTTMIVFDRWWAATGDFDQVAVHNKKSISGSDWQANLLAGSVNNEIEPGLSYDPAYNNFLYTYFDSTAQQFPYLVNDFNVSPSWNLLNTQYNDVAANLVHPHPQVIINPLAVSVGHTWIREGAAGKGIAMFDAENSTYNGTGKKNHADWITLEAVSPNPASTTSTFTFSMTQPETISVNISDIAGRQVLTPVTKKYGSGKNTLTIGVSTLNTGTYLYEFTAGDFRTSGRIIIVR